MAMLNNQRVIVIVNQLWSLSNKNGRVVKPMGVGPPGHPIDGGFPTGFLSLEKCGDFLIPELLGKYQPSWKTVARIW